MPRPLEHVRRRDRASTLATCDATGSAALHGQIVERKGALPSRRVRGLPKASASAA